jgi:hypothetical protein
MHTEARERERTKGKKKVSIVEGNRTELNKILMLEENTKISVRDKNRQILTLMIEMI